MLKKIFCVVGILFLILLSSCNMVKGECTLLQKPKEVEKLSYTEFQEEGYKSFLSKVSDFSARLTDEYHKEFKNDLNTAISPLSLYMALSLAIECANGETKQEILNALDLTYEDVVAYTKKLFSQSTREYETGDKISSREILTNSIWIQNDLEVKKNTIDSLANEYYCYPYAADFKNNNAAANQAIREFIKKQTKGLIDSNFEMSVDTLVTLINTLYLKDIWNNDGDDLRFTSDKLSFKNSDGSTKKMNLLMGEYKLGKVYEEESFMEFYTETNQRYKIKFIVPKDGYTIQEVLTKENLAKVNNKKHEYMNEEQKEMYYTRCLFPEFKASCDKELSSFLKKKFNINLLFDKYNADLTNIADLRKDGDNLYCSEIIHKTKVEVNKKGIEGAAVTVVELDGATSSDPSYKNIYYDFIINKSFGYLITDNMDTVLFSGVIQSL